MIGDYLEKYTFEYLINKALENVPDTLDKRQGSIIYDALAPACYELSDYYMELRKFLNDVFVSTAHNEYLDNRVAERGLTRYMATQAIRKGVFTSTGGVPSVIPIGSRFSTIDGENSVNFEVIGAYVENDVAVPGAYQLQCEVAGTIGNDYVGNLMSITHINGLVSADVTSILVSARDTETDEELRARYYLTIRQNSFGGNMAQYDQELKKIDGVGYVQVYPVWNGGGTVKCSIINSDYDSIDTEEIARIQDIVDPNSEGKGLGIAPIGHKVTITTATPLYINISATIVIDHRYTLEQLRESIELAISNYLQNVKNLWGVADEYGQYSLSIYIARINNAILSVEGVANVTNTTINNSASDLVLTQSATEQQLPMIGTVTLNE